MPLTDPRYEKFSVSVAAGRSKREAAIAAGYSEKDAASRGSKLARRADIAERIQELQNQVATKALEHAQISRERVLEEYAKLAFLDVRKLFRADGTLIPITELDADVAAAIAGLEVETKAADLAISQDGSTTALSVRLHKIKLADKKGALDSLARHLGMFVDRKELTGPHGGPVLIQLLDSFLDDDAQPEGESDTEPQKPRPVRP